MRKLLLIVLIFPCIVSCCEWNKTWSGTCFDKENRNYYFISNSYNGKFVQNNYFDCDNSDCISSWGTYSPANGSILYQGVNDTIWSIVSYQLFWGFEPRNELESRFVTELIYSSFNAKINFPVNQTTWLDCWNDLDIISSTTYLQQLDQECNQLLFLGVSWEFLGGKNRTENNLDNCILT